MSTPESAEKLHRPVIDEAWPDVLINIVKKIKRLRGSYFPAVFSV